MKKPFLYLAAQQGTFGQRTEFSRSSITDALFVYLDGEPEDESVARVDAHFRNRPLVCLTKAWEEQIRAQYPDAAIYPRTVMKPVCRRQKTGNNFICQREKQRHFRLKQSY